MQPVTVTIAEDLDEVREALEPLITTYFEKEKRGKMKTFFTVDFFIYPIGFLAEHTYPETRMPNYFTRVFKNNYTDHKLAKSILLWIYE